MSDYVPVYTPAQAFSSTASAAITGGQLVEVSGSGTCAPAAAGSVKVLGVAAQDVASGARVAIWGEGVHEVTASGTVTAGDQVVAAANGQVATAAAVTTPTAADVTTTRAILGVALTTATTGNLVRFQMR